jgi:hypothetical protein
VAVRIIDSKSGIIYCQVPAIGLTVSMIVRVSSDIEVGHLVNNSALEEVTKWLASKMGDVNEHGSIKEICVPF